LMTRSREIAPSVVVASMARRGAARLRHEMVASVGCMGSSSGKGANGEVAWHEASGGKAARGRCSCNRTDQIIRAQVQKQAPKRSNFRTWAHIIPIVNRNYEGFQTSSLTTKITSFNITHHTLNFTSSSEINLQHHGVAIITNQVHKVAEA
jgi:hypothetical protein